MTVPEESTSATGRKLSGAVSPARTASSKVARVPLPASRWITWMAPAVPPTSSQSVISPMKMPLSCSRVRSSTSTSAWTIGPMPTMATWWSTRPASWSSSSFASAKTSERPIWTEPSAIWERPWPEPPAEMAIETFG